MGFNEFKELWQVVNGWKATFASYDRDHSGSVEGHELQQALTSMGNKPLHSSNETPSGDDTPRDCGKNVVSCVVWQVTT